MIGYIKGIVADVAEDSILLENNGIGWRIFMPQSMIGSGAMEGREVKVYTYMSVREDAMQLFGFLTKDDLNVFKQILNVSGIGPKGALAILSHLPSDDLRFAVLSDDAAAIAKAPGIGKKTAQKLILELKDKFSLEEAFEKKLANSENASPAAAGAKDAETDAVQALVALGYSGTEALQAVKKVGADDSMDSEQILKAALKYIF